MNLLAVRLIIRVRWGEMDESRWREGSGTWACISGLFGWQSLFVVGRSLLGASGATLDTARDRIIRVRIQLGTMSSGKEFGRTGVRRFLEAVWRM
jgi:hypothetical protein